MNSKLYFPYDAPECYLKEAEICLWLTFCLIVLGEVQDQFLKRIWSGAESKAQRFCSAHERPSPTSFTGGRSTPQSLSQCNNQLKLAKVTLKMARKFTSIKIALPIYPR
ncbi:Oidioi.mRNA.OKI2018_I69.PAR.g9431.t2.cds [Oikopleura dioica]|uniref:Oidioi.mRNA.OKI2018_I69.PAR.g9431.t2.cds n=1 Tax=Oikopleura dioica TaxID=34765 RepID=A0ABN7RKN1_OIKDI|nr:Oidioi.mRNA.OKI2018_I69.PAR.g9431.t2.cds [Oikopleura dioica]